MYIIEKKMLTTIVQQEQSIVKVSSSKVGIEPRNLITCGLESINLNKMILTILFINIFNN